MSTVRPQFRVKRGRDCAACIVCMGVAVLGIDLLNPRAGPEGDGRLQWLGAHGAPLRPSTRLGSSFLRSMLSGTNTLKIVPEKGVRDEREQNKRKRMLL